MNEPRPTVGRPKNGPSALIGRFIIEAKINKTLILFGLLLGSAAAEPPTISPFGGPASDREDAVPGRIELSDGSVRTGMIYLTRDKRLQIYDETVQRQREAPLAAVRKIECMVQREWMEKEWRFRESAKDEKVYTGRSYPAREYVYTITLNDGQTITGPLSAIVYLRSAGAARDAKPEQFLLHKRNKGEVGESLKKLVYVKRIRVGNAEDERLQNEK